MEPPRPRYAPDREFPPYSYVPGRSPHPVTDPRGHLFGAAPEIVEPQELDDWRRCRTYLYGIDLFNHGYYWEAHEVWERVWIAAGRGGDAGDFLKGLIKLAAAGVKVREGNGRGAERHLRRAAQLFRQTIESRSESDRGWFGLDPKQLLEWADGTPPDVEVARDESSSPVFDFVLELQR